MLCPRPVVRREVAISTEEYPEHAYHENHAELVEQYRSEADLLAPFVTESSRAVLDHIHAHPGFPGASDPPMLALMAVLLKLMKPIRVLQLGTLIGYSAIVIADILRQNGRGALITVDPDHHSHGQAHAFCEEAGLTELITFCTDYSTGEQTKLVMEAAGQMDFVYLDASHAYVPTLEELDLLLQPGGWVADDGILLLHDASTLARDYDPTGEGGVRRAIDDWLEVNPKLAHHLVLERPLWPAPPGVGLFRRRVTSS